MPTNNNNPFDNDPTIGEDLVPQEHYTEEEQLLAVKHLIMQMALWHLEDQAAEYPQEWRVNCWVGDIHLVQAVNEALGFADIRFCTNMSIGNQRRRAHWVFSLAVELGYMEYLPCTDFRPSDCPEWQAVKLVDGFVNSRSMLACEAHRRFRGDAGRPLKRLAPYQINDADTTYTYSK